MINLRSCFLFIFLINSCVFAFSGCAGTLEDPWQIATAEDLVSIGWNPDLLDKHYVMVADVNMAEYTFDTAVIAPNMPPGEPEYHAIPFTGTFNGDGHKIFNLTIDTLSDNDPLNDNNCFLGLFGKTEPCCNINNLGLENITIVGGDSSNYAGGLIGYSEGGYGFSMCINCYSTGSITAGDYVGGLVGYKTIYMTNCHSECSVTGRNYVGGLAGYNRNTIHGSYTRGSVTGIDYVGGLAGWNEHLVIFCYTDTLIIADNYTGGLIGYVDENGMVSNCYSMGSVTGQDNTGGLLGYNHYGSILNCYSRCVITAPDDAEYIGGIVGYGSTYRCFWDTEVSGILAGYDGTGKTTAEMKQLETFTQADWDFNSVEIDGDHADWQIVSGEYPTLHWQQAIPTFQYDCGEGTKDNPYQISKSEQLISIGKIPELMNKHFILTGDINMGLYNFTSAVIAPSRSVFIGIFDGDGYKIRNLTMDLYTGSSSSSYTIGLGLFGTMGPNSSVKNLAVENAYVVNDDPHLPVGGLTGHNHFGRVSNCYTTGVLIDEEYGSYFLAGLVGANSGEITNCYSTCDVFGKACAGGFVAYNTTEGKISNCYSTGNVEGSNDRSTVGGLTSYNSGKIVDCYAAGAVNGSGYAGGFTYSNSGEIENCYSTGSVSGVRGAGGFVSVNAGVIDRCYSTGEVSGDGDVGGFIGKNEVEIWTCMWDVEASGMSTGCGDCKSDIVTYLSGETTEQMQMESTYTGSWWCEEGDQWPWCEDKRWWINDGRDYPRLWWQPFGDLNNDSHVNTTDFAIMSANWMMDINDEGVDSVCELSGDDAIDTDDLSILINMWLTGPSFEE